MLNPVIKIAIVGNQSTGKSCLIQRIMHDTYNDKYVSGVAIDFFAKKNYQCNLGVFDLHFMDVAGLAKNNDLCMSLIKKADRIALALDLRDERIYEQTQMREYLNPWLQKIEENTKPGTPVLVVGTKCDFDFLSEDAEYLTQLTDYINQEFRREFIVTSAKDGRNINEFIRTVIEAGDRTQQQIQILPQDSRPKPSCWEEFRLCLSKSCCCCSWCCCCCCQNQTEGQDEAPYARQQE